MSVFNRLSDIINSNLNTILEQAEDPEKIVEKEVEVHYLGYYLKWHPQSCYYHSVEHGGFEASPERTPGTYSKYNSIDDRIDDFHYYTTFIKFGIGRATYDAAQEIRSQDIIREEGVALARRFDGEFPDRFALPGLHAGNMTRILSSSSKRSTNLGNWMLPLNLASSVNHFAIHQRVFRRPAKILRRTFDTGALRKHDLTICEFFPNQMSSSLPRGMSSLGSRSSKL